tara:strand:- start:360 stop:818 length:459 start_codon:yes stop_codon:yes gene_type:complete
MFPKQVGTILSVIIVVIGLIALIDYLVLSQEKEEQELVSIFVSYSSTTCSEESSLFFKVINSSKRIVNRVSWNIAAEREGDGINLIDYGSFPSYQGEYSAIKHNKDSRPYSLNKPLSPGEIFSSCYKVPLIESAPHMQTIAWKVINKYSEFQ